MPIRGRGWTWWGPYDDWAIDDAFGRLDTLDQDNTLANVATSYFWAGPTSPTVIPYAWLAPPFRSRADQPINDPQVSVAGGGAARAPNAASIDAYGDFAGNGITLQTEVDADADNLAAYLSSGYADFRMRCSPLAVNLLNARIPPAGVQRVLGVKIGDRILIPDAPPSWPIGNNSLIVQGIGRQIQEGRTRTITWNTGPVIRPSGPHEPNQTLNTNPRFETGISGWSGSNGATVAPGTVAHSGIRSLQVTPDGVTSGGLAWTDDIAIVPGVTYGYVGWVQVTADSSWQVGLTWFDRSHTFIGHADTTMSLTAGTWRHHTGTGVAPVGAYFARLHVQAVGVVPATTVAYLDDARAYALGQWFRWGTSSWGGPDPIPF